MEKRGLNYLQGFAFERSFNKRVLSDDIEIHEAYKLAQENGKLPFNRTKVLIMGDHAAGKTSTCKRLQGKGFRHDEPSTSGIDKNTVNAKVSDVNSKWCEVTNSPLEDYESSAAWWAVSHVRQMGVNKKEKSTQHKHEINNRQVMFSKLTEDFLYQIIHVIPCMIMFLVDGFTFGFGPIAWLYIMCLMYITDIHSGYRFGSGYVIAIVLIDSAMGINEEYNNAELLVTYLSASMIVIMYGLVGLCVGILCGTGGRTGICLAFCLMVHPKQKLFTIENFAEYLLIIHDRAYYRFIITIFAICIIMIYRIINAKLFSLSKRDFILVMIIIIIVLTIVVFFGRPYFFGLLTSSCIIVIVIFTSSGLLVGRKCVAYGYVPQIYFLKKCIGFVAGICIALICGWQFQTFDLRGLQLHDMHYLTIIRYIFNGLSFLAPITGFIIYEWSAFCKVQNTSSIPITHIRQSMQANIRKEPYLDARLSLWDFAGQEMYYNTHHLFMPSHGVYLVLFNAVEAVMNPSTHIKRLKFWLQSIAMHAEIGNVVVFLVGTRRQSVDDKEALSLFDKRVNAHLYRRFSRYLAFHPSGSICFFIENVLQVDKQRNVLREVIYDEIHKLKFFRHVFSLKYLLFKETLNTFCHEKRIITSVQAIAEELKRTWNIISQNELLQFLNFFDKSGDIIYNEQDALLRNYVICEPQMLINILKILVNIPEPHMRNRTVAHFWQRLKNEGVVDSRLLEHICEVLEIWRLYPYIIRFLVGTHLIFPLNINDHVDQVGIFCLPCRLPNINVMSDIWNSNEHSQDNYYLDFGEILPEFLFLRLLAKCCEAFTWDRIYYNAARFRATNSCLFLINTQVISGSDADSYDRNIIKLSVHNEEHTQSTNVLQKIINFTDEIMNQNFNPEYFLEHYICGPECNVCSSLDGVMHVVNLIAHGNDVSNLEGYKPDQYHTVLFNTKVIVTLFNILA